MAPLRVLLMNSLAPPFGGAEAHFADLADLLRERGLDVETYVPPPARGLRAWRDRLLNPGVTRHVRERIREFRPDVIHVHNFFLRLSVAPFLAARGTGVATLLTVHDFQLFCPRTWALRSDGSPCPEPRLALCALGNCRGGVPGLSGRVVYAANTVRQRAAARVVRRHATRIIAPSRALAERLTSSLGREVGHVPYRPAPVPTREFEPPRNADLLFVGRVSREKGLRELLLALGPADRLTIAGDGPELATLRTLADARGLAGVRFLGRVGRPDLAGLRRSHGALVVPSLWMENSPLVIHESLAAGRPVIGSRRGGIPELVLDGETGLLFDPLAPASIAAALARYRAMDSPSRTAMARRAWDFARLAADRSAGGALMESEYAEAAARARGGAR